MKLRTRIAFAFFVVSVVPLTVVTAYNYYASATALKRAEATQADRMAIEMRNRVGSVVTDIGDRVDRLWRLRVAIAVADGRAAFPEPADTQDASLRGQAIALLAEAAPMLDRIDIVPTAPAVPSESSAGTVPPRARSGMREGPPRGIGRTPPPGSGRRAGPNGSGGVGRDGGPGPGRGGAPPPAPIQSMPPFTLDLSQARGAAAAASELTELTADEVVAWQRAIQRLTPPGTVSPLDATARGELAAQTALAAARTAEREQHLAALAAGQPLQFDMHRGTEIVGHATATVSRKRLIETVLSLARRDRGELPFVVDAQGQIDTIGDEASRTLAGLGLDITALRPDAPSVAQTLGDYLVVMRRDQSGIVFGIARPVGDSLRGMRRTSMVNLGLGTLLIGVLCIAIIPLSSRLTRDLAALTDGIRRLDLGERRTRVAIDSRDEVGELASAFNKMAADLESHEKTLVEQERLRRELELCRQIQNDMLPHGPLRAGWSEMAGISVPAREVGGDFFNYFVLPNGELALLVGDVSGKGVGAALLMANVQATLRAKLPLELDLTALVDTVDRDLAANTPSEVFVTLFVGIFNQNEKVLRYVNAGHNPQYLVHAGGAIDTLSSTGMPVGMMAGQGYVERRVAIEDSALLFLYTDGAVELEDESGDAFGAERLQDAIRGRDGTTAQEVLTHVEAALKTFRGTVEPLDDATIMAVRLSTGNA